MTFEENFEILSVNLKDIAALTMLLATLNKQESDILKEVIKKVKTLENFGGTPVPKDLTKNLGRNLTTSEANAKDLMAASIAFRTLAESLEGKD